jgi:hypothetical protein
MRERAEKSAQDEHEQLGFSFCSKHFHCGGVLTKPAEGGG